MRNFDEVGTINFSDETNEAYRTYASIYLDFVDDNMSHFRWRDIDINPINELEESGEEITDETVKKSYLKHAVGIAKSVLSGGYYKSFNDLYNDYPLLRTFSKELENEFYEEEKI